MFPQIHSQLHQRYPHLNPFSLTDIFSAISYSPHKTSSSNPKLELIKSAHIDATLPLIVFVRYGRLFEHLKHEITPPVPSKPTTQKKIMKGAKHKTIFIDQDDNSSSSDSSSSSGLKPVKFGQKMNIAKKHKRAIDNNESKNILQLSDLEFLLSFAVSSSLPASLFCLDDHFYYVSSNSSSSSTYITQNVIDSLQNILKQIPISAAPGTSVLSLFSFHETRANEEARHRLLLSETRCQTPALFQYSSSSSRLSEDEDVIVEDN